MPDKRVACVEIGGIPISLSTTSGIFFDLLARRYEGFLSHARAETELEFDLIEGTASDDDVRVRREGSHWVLQRGDFLARWDPQAGKGVVRQNANPYSLDAVLRIVHSLLLARRGGFLLHAASAICAGRAFLFSGVSGAGKTTMTRLAPADVTLLTDEISYIQRGPGGEFRAFGTPFAGELAKAGENTSAPISALFFLEKGPENRIEPVPPAEAVRRLMRNILFFSEDPELVEKILATACEFVSTLPVERLTFYPDARVWAKVREFEGESVHV